MPQIGRVTCLKQQGGSAYNKLSRWYDLVSGDFEYKPSNAAIHQLAPNLSESILEIGCGTGQAIVRIIKLVGWSGKIIVLDISNEILIVPQARVKKTGAGDQVTLLCGDGISLPFEGISFDGILVSFTLELFNSSGTDGMQMLPANEYRWNNLCSFFILS